MTDERLPWFPCYPDKLLGALASMRAPEGYVYTVVLLRIYESGGSCRDTLDALVTRTKLNRRTVSDALDSLFRSGRLVRRDDGIHNPKAELVLSDSNAVRQERKRAGEKGASARWKKDKENQTTSHGKANAEPLAKNAHLHLQEQDSLFPSGNRPVEPKPKKPMTALEIDRKDLFDRGKIVLGDGSGGFIQKLLAFKHGNIALARAAIEQASTMDNPREYIGGILRGGLNETNRNGNSKGSFSGLAARLRRDIEARKSPSEASMRSTPADPEPAGRR